MKSTRKAFTLVELLVVIAILAILASVAVVGYTSFIDKANDSNAETELHQIKAYITAELMSDDKMEFTVEGVKYVITRTSGRLTATAGVDSIPVDVAIEACPDLEGLGTFEIEGEDLVYTSSNGKGTARWEDIVYVCDHTYSQATCTTLATCSKCGSTTGEYAAHTERTAATCENPAVCDVCEQPYGELAAHVFSEGLCTVCGELDVNYTVTIYFQNSFLWSDVSVYYWKGATNNNWPGAKMTLVGNDGTYDIYSLEVPAKAEAIIINGIKNDGSGNRDQTQDIPQSQIKDNYIYFVHFNSSSENTNKNEVYCCPYTNTFKTVNFSNEWGWSNIKIHYWYTDGTNNWDQKAWDSRDNMNQNGTTYTYELPSYAVGFVITGEYGGKVYKTLDQTVSDLTDGYTYYPNDCVLIGDEQSTNRETITVFFRNNWYWKNAKIYQWDSQVNNGWPGVSMDKVGNDGTYDIYCKQIPSDSVGIIFTGNKDTDNSFQQTINIEDDLYDGAIYELFWNNNNNEYKLVTYK